MYFRHINWACLNCGKGAFIEAVPKSPAPTFDDFPKVPRIRSTELLIAEVKTLIL